MLAPYIKWGDLIRLELSDVIGGAKRVCGDFGLILFRILLVDPNGELNIFSWAEVGYVKTQQYVLKLNSSINVLIDHDSFFHLVAFLNSLIT